MGEWEDREREKEREGGGAVAGMPGSCQGLYQSVGVNEGRMVLCTGVYREHTYFMSSKQVC